VPLVRVLGHVSQVAVDYGPFRKLWRGRLLGESGQREKKNKQQAEAWAHHASSR
jgi:hypothetical protein